MRHVVCLRIQFALVFRALIMWWKRQPLWSFSITPAAVFTRDLNQFFTQDPHSACHPQNKTKCQTKATHEKWHVPDLKHINKTAGYTSDFLLTLTKTEKSPVNVPEQTETTFTLQPHRSYLTHCWFHTHQMNCFLFTTTCVLHLTYCDCHMLVEFAWRLSVKHCIKASTLLKFIKFPPWAWMTLYL